MRPAVVNFAACSWAEPGASGSRAGESGEATSAVQKKQIRRVRLCTGSTVRLAPGRPARGYPRRAHFEMLLGIGDDLAVARVIGSFHRDDALADLRVLLPEGFGQFGFRAGRPDDQDFAGVAQGTGHLSEKFLVGCGVAAADRVGLVMKVPSGEMRMQGDLVVAGEAEVEDPGLAMVDPDDRVKMGWHVLSFLIGSGEAARSSLISVPGNNHLSSAAYWRKIRSGSGRQPD